MPTTLAFVACDRQKDSLVAFVEAHAGMLERYSFVATEGTGRVLTQGAGAAVERVLPGAMGGDAQIAARVVEGSIGAVVVLGDASDESRAQVALLRRVCDLHDVPMATNLATARAIVVALSKSRIAHLIFNPVSGQGNPNQELRLIRELLEPQVLVELVLTQPEVDPAAQAREAIADGADLVIASGGDGTVSAVAGAVMQTETPLGVIPRGTANAFSVALGIPTDLRGACQTILAGTTVQVDVATCNGAPMILLAGIGFEAETVERANREMKNRFGALAYIFAGVQQFADQEAFEAEIEIEGEVNRFECNAITVANAAPATSVMAQGFGMVVTDDGLLDVTVGLSTLEAQGFGARLQGMGAMADLLRAALVKQPTQSEDILSLRVPKLTVTTSPPQKVVVDGEIVGTTPVVFDCIEKGLTVVAPIGVD